MRYIYKVDLENYQFREISKDIVEYSQDLRRSLFSSIRQYARAEGLDPEYEVKKFKGRIKKGWKLFVLRPKQQIKGWIFLAPNSSVHSWYVFRRFREKGYGSELLYAVMNEAETALKCSINYSSTAALAVFESVLSKICCKVSLEKTS